MALGRSGPSSTDPRFTPADSTVRKNQPPGPYLLIATRSGQVMQLSFSRVPGPFDEGRPPLLPAPGERQRDLCRAGERGRDDVSGHARRPRDPLQDRRRADSGRTRQGRAGNQAGTRRRSAGRHSAGPPCRLPARDQRPRQATELRPNEIRRHGSRGGKGIKTSTRTGFKEIVPPPIELVDWDQFEEKRLRHEGVKTRWRLRSKSNRTQAERRITAPAISRSSKGWRPSGGGRRCISAASTAAGLHHLLWEIVDNSVDEYLAEAADHIVGHAAQRRRRRSPSATTAAAFPSTSIRR